MKDVIISIKGLQGTTENGDDIELVTDGTYSNADGKTVFSYMESELTGLEGTKTEFLVDGELVMITRTGTVNMQMTFQEGQKHYFVYSMPFGNLTIGVETHSIRNELNDNGGYLEVKYLLDMGNSMVTRNTFEISIKEAK
jgi:uncharacterized beta-barrel protein YwiB (DUF1934 family)